MSGEMGAQLTSSVEQGLVDGVTAGPQFGHEHVQRGRVEHDGDEDPSLVRGQLLLHGLVHGSDERARLRDVLGIGPKATWKPVPVLLIELGALPTPCMSREPVRHLEDDDR